MISGEVAGIMIWSGEENWCLYQFLQETAYHCWLLKSLTINYLFFMQTEYWNKFTLISYKNHVQTTYIYISFYRLDCMQVKLSYNICTRRYQFMVCCNIITTLRVHLQAKSSRCYKKPYIKLQFKCKINLPL